MPVVETSFISLHRSADNEDIAPFPELLDQGVEGVPADEEHTAQSPLLTEEPSGFYNQQKIRDSFLLSSWL